MVIIFSILLFSQNYDSPWESIPDTKIITNQKNQTSEFKPVFFIPLATITLYQKVFSKSLGESCNFEPSCSHYAHYSIKKYGLEGYIMVFDRLIRCNYFSWQYAKRYYELKEIEGRGLKLYDPPENNTISSRK